jgi:hypothetical protein
MDDAEKLKLITLANDLGYGIAFGNEKDLKHQACFGSLSRVFKGDEDIITYLYKTRYPVEFIYFHLKQIFRKIWKINLESIGAAGDGYYIYLLRLELKEPSFWIPAELRLRLFYYTLLIARLFDHEFCLNERFINGDYKYISANLIDMLPTATHYILAVATKNNSKGNQNHFIHDSLWMIIQFISKDYSKDSVIVMDTIREYPQCVWEFLNGIFDILKTKKHLKIALESCKSYAKNTEISDSLSRQFDKKRKEV